MKPLVQTELVNDPFGDPGLYADFLFRKRALLFDLGDLSRMPARKLLRVSHALVSHAHIDHFIGFDRLLRLLIGRDWVLHIIGPPGFIQRVESKLNGYSWNLIGRYPVALTVTVSEYHPDGFLHTARFQGVQGFQKEQLSTRRAQNDIVVEENDIRIRAAVLEHDIPCLAFALEEPRHVNVLKNRLEKRRFQVGPWLAQLKAEVLKGVRADTLIPARRLGNDGRPIETPVPLPDLTDLVSVVPGQKVAYVTDVRYHSENEERIVGLVRNADHLYIEAVFLQKDKHLAERKRHLTAAQAGRIARLAHAKRITVFHFSPRYAGREQELCREAQRAFEA
jgi:ribonuclease Z